MGGNDWSKASQQVPTGGFCWTRTLPALCSHGGAWVRANRASSPATSPLPPLSRPSSCEGQARREQRSPLPGPPSLTPSGTLGLLVVCSGLTQAQCSRRYNQLKQQRPRDKQDIRAQTAGLSATGVKGPSPGTQTPSSCLRKAWPSHPLSLDLGLLHG